MTNEIHKMVLFLEKLDDKYDIIYSNYSRFIGNTVFWESNHDYDNEKLDKFNYIEAAAYLWGDIKIGWHVHCKIFKRSFLIDNNLFFDKRFIEYEDADYNLNAICFAKKVTSYKDNLYKYRKDNPNSLTSSVRTINHFLSIRFFTIKWFNYFLPKLYEYECCDKILKRLSYNYNRGCSLIPKIDLKDRRLALSLMKNDCIIKNYTDFDLYVQNYTQKR